MQVSRLVTKLLRYPCEYQWMLWFEVMPFSSEVNDLVEVCSITAIPQGLHIHVID